MTLSDVTFTGPAIDDWELFTTLPDELQTVLRDINGFVAFRGGLHVRGACVAPEWHSLRSIWTGPSSLASLYSVVLISDIPFAQDAVGDQFLLRDATVWRLAAETGGLEPLGTDLLTFLHGAAERPDEHLLLGPLLEFERRGGSLQPGQLLNVYPPFCTKESAGGVDLRAVSMQDRLGFLASFAMQIANLAEGSVVRVVTKP